MTDAADDSERPLWDTNADDPGRPHCHDCRFYRRKGDRCQRYPPVVFYDVSNLQTVCRYPTVGGGMWCGEFAARLIYSATAEVTGSGQGPREATPDAELGPGSTS